MCKYCDEGKPLYNDWHDSQHNEGCSGADAKISGDRLVFNGADDIKETNFIECEIDIYYCPMCGAPISF